MNAETIMLASSDAKMAAVAADQLHIMCQEGAKANASMIDELAQLNKRWAHTPRVLADIQKRFTGLSKDDPLFINEVQIGKDGSLQFSPNKITSPALEKIQKQFCLDLLWQEPDEQYPTLHGRIEGARPIHLEIEAMQKEEKNLAAHQH